MDNLLLSLFGGASGAAVIALISNIIMWKLNRKAALEDRKNDSLSALREGQRVLLLDRMQYVSRDYIRKGAVDIDDRRRLHQMHDAYHALGGNGDMDSLLEEVNELPVK